MVNYGNVYHLLDPPLGIWRNCGSRAEAHPGYSPNGGIRKEFRGGLTRRQDYSVSKCPAASALLMDREVRVRVRVITLAGLLAGPLTVPLADRERE